MAERPTLDLEVLIVVDFVKVRGQIFFSFFQTKYDMCCPLVAKICITDVSESMYTQKMGLKTVFFDLLSLSITEMV